MQILYKYFKIVGRLHNMVIKYTLFSILQYYLGIDINII